MRFPWDPQYETKDAARFARGLAVSADCSRESEQRNVTLQKPMIIDYLHRSSISSPGQ